MTHNSIRSSGFWIIGGVLAVSNHISKCVKCRKVRGELQKQRMADLPEDRLKPSPPFTYSAVDYFGSWGWLVKGTLKDMGFCLPVCFACFSPGNGD
jgi:hypothetical protein